ncbi:MAG: hypothetical protein JOY99_11930 [Sphingomonadaceae bacterium]|nr:hypothetical protein [Sphingomonadaceae bacterium]
MTETPQERQEAAAIRKRWINLGELLAIAAVIISALTLWNSYKERSNAESDRSVEARKADTRAHRLVLKASVAANGARVDLAPSDADQVLQGQTLLFPSSLTLSPIETTGDARIEAGWFADAVKKARDKDATKAVGDLRLPVAITTRYLAGDATLSDTAIYEIGYTLEGHFLGGTAVKLKGLSVARHISAKDAQRAVDAAWSH